MANNVVEIQNRKKEREKRIVEEKEKLEGGVGGIRREEKRERNRARERKFLKENEKKREILKFGKGLGVGRGKIQMFVECVKGKCGFSAD